VFICPALVKIPAADSTAYVRLRPVNGGVFLMNSFRAVITELCGGSW